MTATITVRNVGAAPAGVFQVQWRPWLLATPLAGQVNGLAPGASASVNLSYAFPSVGHFDGTAIVDYTGVVSELNELNNFSATAVDTVQPTLNAQKIAQGGFGDSRNSYSWSMAWFNGKLYVGTARSAHCVEAATLDFFYPGRGHYGGPLDGLPEANCAADKYDNDLRAEIWQYTPGRRVGEGVSVATDREPASGG